MKPEAKLAALQALAQEVRACTHCPLHRSRQQAVPGDGNISAAVLLLADAPGPAADAAGFPFMGRWGSYLERLLSLAALVRQDVYLTYLVKCHPPHNREAHAEEIRTCYPYLEKQIALVDPLLVVTMGRNSAAQFFPQERLSQIQGQARPVEGRLYLPLFHPAVIMQNPELAPLMENAFKALPQLLKDARDGIDPGQPRRPAPPPPQQGTLF